MTVMIIELTAIPGLQAPVKKEKQLREFERLEVDVESTWRGSTTTGASASTVVAPSDPKPKKRKTGQEGASGEIRCLKCNRSSKARFCKQSVSLFNVHSFLGSLALALAAAVAVVHSVEA